MKKKSGCIGRKKDDCTDQCFWKNGSKKIKRVQKQGYCSGMEGATTQIIPRQAVNAVSKNHQVYKVTFDKEQNKKIYTPLSQSSFDKCMYAMDDDSRKRHIDKLLKREFYMPPKEKLYKIPKEICTIGEILETPFEKRSTHEMSPMVKQWYSENEWLQQEEENYVPHIAIDIKPEPPRYKEEQEEEKPKLSVIEVFPPETLEILQLFYLTRYANLDRTEQDLINYYKYVDLFVHDASEVIETIRKAQVARKGQSLSHVILSLFSPQDLTRWGFDARLIRSGVPNRHVPDRYYWERYADEFSRIITPTKLQRFIGFIENKIHGNNNKKKYY